MIDKTHSKKDLINIIHTFDMDIQDATDYNKKDLIDVLQTEIDKNEDYIYEDNIYFIQCKKDLIDYAATDFASLRDSLISYMKAVYPTDYQNFTESDYGMMFTELVAYMGAIMSFKADAVANENFLTTAKNRRNVRKLLQLIGINLKGPTSAGANAELLLESVAGSDFYISPEDRMEAILNIRYTKQLVEK